MQHQQLERPFAETLVQNWLGICAAISREKAKSLFEEFMDPVQMKLHSRMTLCVHWVMAISIGAIILCI
jgi:hypothetical protein